MKRRCEWCGDDPLYVAYHDEEWGVPVHDDRMFFEYLILDGAQAGLSWITILKRREEYRKAFDNFDPQKVALYDENKIEELMKNPGIIRNRLKIKSAVGNAKAFLKIQEEFGSFDSFIWGFFGGKVRKNRWDSLSQIPSFTDESLALSKVLRKRGFNFVGPTIIYAFMQAAGIVNDHTTYCFRYE
jgi:DNA-3-methyladenine glycosylase I